MCVEPNLKEGIKEKNLKKKNKTLQINWARHFVSTLQKLSHKGYQLYVDIFNKHTEAAFVQGKRTLFSWISLMC